MSWEVFKTHKISCLCGKGIIKQDLLSDDWNHITETNPRIECNECSEKYEIISKFYNPKPHHEYTIYYCVNKENGEKIKLDL